MFWHKRENKHADVAELVRPEPEKLVKPLGTVTSPVIPDQYRALADKIGFAPGAMLNLELKAFLVEQQIPIYNYADVRNYMTMLAERQGLVFNWRPLRQKDKNVFSNWGWGFGQQHDFYQRENNACAVYDKLVPLRALQDVETIDARFDGKVAFFVSDYAAPTPDPFLMVCAPTTGVKRYVIAAWDEPGFGVV